MIECIVGVDVGPGFANDTSQLQFVIELVEVVELLDHLVTGLTVTHQIWTLELAELIIVNFC